MEEKRRKKTSHCFDCDRCVENMDHHCVVTGMCIGKKNVFGFYGMLVCYVVWNISAMLCFQRSLDANECEGSRNPVIEVILRMVFGRLGDDVVKNSEQASN